MVQEEPAQEVPVEASGAAAFRSVRRLLRSPGGRERSNRPIVKTAFLTPEGRISLADLTRCVSVLISSGTDWTDQTKRLAARAPKLDIFGDSFVLRDDLGWQVPEKGDIFWRLSKHLCR